MKVAIHLGYGGFTLPHSAVLYLQENYDEDVDAFYFSYGNLQERSHPTLINAIQLFSEECHEEGVFIANIPDEATDYRIMEYDGAETVIYVLNGKICEIGSKEIEM